MKRLIIIMIASLMSIGAFAQIKLSQIIGAPDSCYLAVTNANGVLEYVHKDSLFASTGNDTIYFAGQPYTDGDDLYAQIKDTILACIDSNVVDYIFQNGLTETNGVVEFGGTLLHNTSIDGMGFEFIAGNMLTWTILSDEIQLLGQNSTQIESNNILQFQGGIVNITTGPTDPLYISTQLLQSGGTMPGYVLTLIDPITGEAEWQPIGAIGQDTLYFAGQPYVNGDDLYAQIKDTILACAPEVPDEVDGDVTNELDTIYFDGVPYVNGDDLYAQIKDTILACAPEVPDEVDGDVTNELDTIYFDGVPYVNGDDLYAQIKDTILACAPEVPDEVDGDVSNELDTLYFAGQSYVNGDDLYAQIKDTIIACAPDLVEIDGDSTNEIQTFQKVYSSTEHTLRLANQVGEPFSEFTIEEGPGIDLTNSGGNCIISATGGSDTIYFDGVPYVNGDDLYPQVKDTILACIIDSTALLRDEDGNTYSLSGIVDVQRSLHVTQGTVGGLALGVSHADSDQDNTLTGITNNHRQVVLGSTASSATGSAAGHNVAGVYSSISSSATSSSTVYPSTVLGSRLSVVGGRANSVIGGLQNTIAADADFSVHVGGRGNQIAGASDYTASIASIGSMIEIAQSSSAISNSGTARLTGRQSTIMNTPGSTLTQSAPGSGVDGVNRLLSSARSSTVTDGREIIIGAGQNIVVDDLREGVVFGSNMNITDSERSSFIGEGITAVDRDQTVHVRNDTVHIEVQPTTGKLYIEPANQPTSAINQVLTQVGSNGETEWRPISGGAGSPLDEIVVYSEEYFGYWAPGVLPAVRNITLTQTGVGQWDVVFATPHPDGIAYHPSLTTEEESNLRDTPDITVVQGSKTPLGFQIQITTGDNGGGADIYVDAPFSIGVDAPVTVAAPN